jgi:hypothetical protein
MQSALERNKPLRRRLNNRPDVNLFIISIRTHI